MTVYQSSANTAQCGDNCTSRTSGLVWWMWLGFFSFGDTVAVRLSVGLGNL